MDSIPLLITVLVILLGLSAFFSASETAFTSYSRTRMKSMAEDGKRKAVRVLRLTDNYDKLLSTILIGNNIVNITSTSLATILFINLMTDQDMGTLVSTVVMTLAVLTFGEILPKAIAKEHPEGFSMTVAPIFSFLTALFTPLVLLFVGLKKLITCRSKKEECAITESEILTFVEEAEQEGGIDEQESELIKSAIEFNDMDADEILTPRVDVVGIPIDADIATIEGTFAESGFSRLPVYEESIDNIVGVLHQKDFFNDRRKPLTELMQKPTFVTPNMKIGDVLRQLQQAKTHMAIIADEFGGTLGIVTMEDILEELVGEIWDEHDEVVEEFVALEGGKYRILCSADLDKMFELFEIDTESESSTVSGWVVENLGKIPEVGDTFESDALAVTVTETDSRRALEIEVTVMERGEDGEDEDEDEKDEE